MSDAEPLPGEPHAPAKTTPTGGPSTPTTRDAPHKKWKKTQKTKAQSLLEQREGGAPPDYPPPPHESSSFSALGAAVLAGGMSLLSLALGLWIGRATAGRAQYTALRV